MWPWLIPLGIELVSNLFDDDEPKAPEKMPYEDALGQAEDVLRPSYDKSVGNVMQNVNNNMVSRGFYGQAPGDNMRANVKSDMASDYESQKSNYAQNLQNNDYTQQYQTYQTGLNQKNQQAKLDKQPDPFWSSVGLIAGSWAGSKGGSDLITSWFTG